MLLEMEQRVAAILQRALGEDHPRHVQALANMAQTLADLDRLDDALAVEARVVDARKRSSGSAHPLYADALANMADVLGKCGRHQDALGLQQANA